MKYLYLFFAVAFLFACGDIEITRENEVRITEKPVPIDSVDFSAIKADFQLDEIISPANLTGSLSPRYPVALGTIRGYDQTALYTKGCLGPVGFYLIIKKDSVYRLLKNNDDFIRYFAPIESKEEALSYLLAFTGRDAQYDFSIEARYRKFVRKINTTSVKENKDGYEINLFDYQLCGCGPHTYYMVVYTVKKTGEVIEQEIVRLYEDPYEDGLCVD